MRRILLLSLLLALLGRSTPAQAQLPGACAGTTTPTLGICVPPSGQNPWLAEWQDFATKTDTHAANTATPHGATPAATANRLVLRDASGNASFNVITGALTGNSTTTSAMFANPAGCNTNEFAFDSQANGALVCTGITAANVSGVLPLTAGASVPLTDALYLDNLGLRCQPSDTNPVCSAGIFTAYCDTSEQKWKKCENGVLSDFGSGVGGSGTITRVWSVTSGDVTAITAGAGHTFDAGAATASSPCTRGTTLPATCSEGQCHQDTDSGGSETYRCTATNTWTKQAATTDTAPLATALAATPVPCATGNATLGILANGNSTGCFDVAMQTEFNSHTAETGTAHGATTAPTPSSIVKRDLVGGTVWQSSIVTVATLPTCTASAEETHIAVSDGDTSTDCISGGGSTTARCICDGSNWTPDSSGGGGVGTEQSVYNNSEPNPTLTSGINGYVFSNFNSFTKSKRMCDGPQCKREYMDGSGVIVTTHDLPGDMVWKVYPGKTLGWLANSGLPSLTSNAAGALTVATSLVSIGSGTITANRTPCSLTTEYLKNDGTCGAVSSGASNSVTVLHTVAGGTTVVNNTATTVYTFTLPGGTLGTKGCSRTTLIATGFNNTGATQAFTFLLKYGGTSTASVAISPGTASSTRHIKLDGLVCGDGTTSSQRLLLAGSIATNLTTTGASAAINSTVDQTLEVTVQLAITDATNLTYTPEYGMTEKVPGI